MHHLYSARNPLLQLVSLVSVSDVSEVADLANIDPMCLRGATSAGEKEREVRWSSPVKRTKLGGMSILGRYL